MTTGESTTHWPADSGKTCFCGDTFATTARFREHLRVWAQGLRRIEFKHHADHWTSRTLTPMHTFTAYADRVNPFMYEVNCQCGWVKRAHLPLAGGQQEQSPGRLAVAHIREVVAERLTLEEALDDPVQ